MALFGLMRSNNDFSQRFRRGDLWSPAYPTMLNPYLGFQLSVSTVIPSAVLHLYFLACCDRFLCICTKINRTLLCVMAEMCRYP